MSTFRSFECIGAVTASSLWDAVDNGDTLEWIFSEGVYIAQWDGSYTPHITAGHPTIGAFITVTLGDFYEITDQSNPGVPISQASIQALINGGATIFSIGGSYSATNFDGRLDYVNPSTPTTLAELAGMQWTFTVNSIVLSPVMSLVFASGFITLEVPDVPTLELVGSGGVNIDGNEGAIIESSGFPTTMLIIVGSGGIVINSSAFQVLSADISGLYTLVKNKTDDTLYQRIGFSIFVGTYDTKIPDPFIKTGFIGN